MVRYLDKNSGKSKLDKSSDSGQTNPNIISQAIQQEIQKKQGLSPKAEEVLNRGLILQEKNELIQALKEEKEALKEEIRLLSQQIKELNQKLENQTSDSLSTDDSQNINTNKKLNQKIADLESQLYQLNGLLETKDAKIIRLSQNTEIHDKNNTGLLKNFLIILSLLILGTGLSVSFFSFQPPKYEAHIPLQTDQIPELFATQTSLSSKVEVIKSPRLLGEYIEQNEILPMDTTKKEEALAKLIEHYQRNLTTDISKDRKVINIYYTDKSASKAANIVNNLANIFIKQTARTAQKMKLQKAIASSQQSIKELESKADSEKTSIDNLSKMNNYQKVSLPTYKKLKDKTNQDLYKIRNEMAPLTAQINRFEIILNELNNSDSTLDLTKTRIQQSPILRNLLEELKAKEFNRAVFLLDNPSTHEILIEQAKAITELKANMVDMVKVYLAQTFTPEEENELTIRLMNLFAETKMESLENILNGFYWPSEKAEENQIQIRKQQIQFEETEREISIQQKALESFQTEMAAVDQNALQVITLNSPSHTEISKKTKILYSFFCLIGLTLGLAIPYLLLKKRPRIRKQVASPNN